MYMVKTWGQNAELHLLQTHDPRLRVKRKDMNKKCEFDVTNKNSLFLLSSIRPAIYATEPVQPERVETAWPEREGQRNNYAIRKEGIFESV